MRSFNKILIIICLIFFCGNHCLSATKENIADSNALTIYPHKWIEQDKMRAGYLYFNDPVSKIKLIKALKLNTIIVKCWRFDYPRSKQNTINLMREWAKVAKDNNLHLFFAINWQPYTRTKGIGYERVVYEDGTKGIAVCPLDKEFWQERIQNVMLLVANMSKEPGLQIDGIFLDMEIYGSEKELAERRNYYEKKCGFSDLCFTQYLVDRGYELSQFSLVEEKYIKSWLTSQNLLGDYFVFLRLQLQNKAAALRESISEVNPELLLGMYPHPVKNNWVQYPLAKGFSSERMPFVVFGVHSYGYNKDENGDGYTRIPKDIKCRYKKDGISILYSAGYLFSKYSSQSLERNLKQSNKHWDGYWLFTLKQLWGEDSKYKLIDSEKIIEAVKASN